MMLLLLVTVNVALAVWDLMMLRRLRRLLRMATAEYQKAVLVGQEMQVLSGIPRIVLSPVPGQTVTPVWLKVPREQLEALAEYARN